LFLISIVSSVHPFCTGSTLYAMETGEHPAILRNSVTSPAGTTASAIYELEKGGLRPLGTNEVLCRCCGMTFDAEKNDFVV
jgi:pyrroline-5-carboxylate reductase